MNVFASIFCYPLGKEAVSRRMNLARLVQIETESGLDSKWPGFRTLFALKHMSHLEGIMLYHDGSTLIARARSCAAYAFLESPCDVWLSVDDDVQLNAPGVALLLEAVSKYDLVFVPQPTAHGSLNCCFLNVGIGDPRWEAIDLVELSQGDWRTMDGQRVRSRVVPVDWCGTSLFAASRHAIETMRAKFPELDASKTSNDERPALGLFLEEIKDHIWMPEDVRFCQRAREAGIDVNVLVDVDGSMCKHSGFWLETGWFDKARASSLNQTQDAAPPA